MTSSRMFPETEQFKNIKAERTDDPEKLLLSADCKDIGRIEVEVWLTPDHRAAANGFQLITEHPVQEGMDLFTYVGKEVLREFLYGA